MTGSIFSFRSLVYLMYAVVLTVVLLYVRFPTEKFKTYCEYRLEQVLGNGRCTIAEIGYYFPAAIELRKVKMGQPAGDINSGVLLDRLKFSPALKGFFTSWVVDGELYEGAFQAILAVQFKEKIFQLKAIKLEDADISTLTKSIPSFGREITGLLTFSGEYRAKFDQPKNGLGSGSVYFSAGSVPLVRQILTLDSIDFEEVKAIWKYDDNKLILTEGTLRGQQLDADFAGTVETPFLPPEGGLSINGSLLPQEKFLQDKPQIERLVQRLMKQYKKSAVPFRVGGTLNKPTFRLSM